MSKTNPESLPERLRPNDYVNIEGRCFQLDLKNNIVRVSSDGIRCHLLDLDTTTGQRLYAQLRAKAMAAFNLEQENEAADPELADDLEDEQGGEESSDRLANEETEELSGGIRVRVFEPDAIRKADLNVKNQEAERRQRVKVLTDAARLSDGYRSCPLRDVKQVSQVIGDLREAFPNFGRALDALEASFALAIGDPDYAMPALLVHGAPGIGKTSFAMAVAEALVVPFDMVSGGSLQGGFDLSGTSQHWNNSSPGRVVRLLAEGNSASPVLLIDEVDKLSGDERYSPVTTLLDLLEPRTARRFRDESLQLVFDASRMVVLMTANDIKVVPLTLISRAQVVEIEPPDVAQRLAIVRNLVSRYAGSFEIPEEAIARIAGSERDLRKLQQVIRKAFGLSRARQDEQVFYQVIEADLKVSQERGIGFI